MQDTEQYAQRIHRVVAALSHRVTADEVAEALVRRGRATSSAACAAAVFLFDDARDSIVLVRMVGYSPKE